MPALNLDVFWIDGRQLGTYPHSGLNALVANFDLSPAQPPLAHRQRKPILPPKMAELSADRPSRPVQALDDLVASR